MKRIEIRPSEEGQRLDKFLRRYFPEAGTGFFYRMLRKKNILRNGKKAQGNELLEAGDSLDFWFSDETFDKLTGKAGAADAEEKLDSARILFEDEDILVVNKPAGLLSQKSRSEETSLVELIRGYLLTSGQMTEEDFRLYRPGVLNRLDRNTSGLVIAAKNLRAARRWSERLAGHGLTKEYLALAEGEVKKRQRLRAFLMKEEKTNRVKVSETAAKGAKAIETEVRPLAFSKSENCTLLSVRLFTGRSHQIRAQLSAIGHPILGDPKYGSAEGKKKAGRQMLHARRLTVETDGEKAWEATAPLPEDFLRVCEKCGIDTRSTDGR